MSEQMTSKSGGLAPVEEKFILHWGEMGTKWGINRTVAQVHALLYLAAKPLPADEISTTLSVARSNVSTSLRELQGWGIVRVVHVLGDRRDHFETLKEVWEIFRIFFLMIRRPPRSTPWPTSCYRSSKSWRPGCRYG